MANEALKNFLLKHKNTQESPLGYLRPFAVTARRHPVKTALVTSGIGLAGSLAADAVANKADEALFDDRHPFEGASVGAQLGLMSRLHINPKDFAGKIMQGTAKKNLAKWMLLGGLGGGVFGSLIKEKRE